MLPFSKIICVNDISKREDNIMIKVMKCNLTYSLRTLFEKTKKKIITIKGNRICKIGM